MNRISLIRTFVGIVAAAASLSAMFTFTPGAGAGGAGYLVGRVPATDWLAKGGTSGMGAADAAVVIMLFDHCDPRSAGAGLSAESIATASSSVENSAALAAQLGLSASTVIKLQQAGMSAEDMLTLSALVKVSGRSAEQLAAERAAGQTWDQISAGLGLKLGSLCANAPSIVSASSNVAATMQATTAAGPSANSAVHVDAAASGRASVPAAPAASAAQNRAAAGVRTCAGVQVGVDAQACARLVAALTKANTPQANSSAALNTCAQLAATVDAQGCLKIAAALNSLKGSVPQSNASLDAKIDVQPAKQSAAAPAADTKSSLAGSPNANVPATADAAAGLSADAHALPITVTSTLSVQTHAQLPSVLGAGIDLR